MNLPATTGYVAAVLGVSEPRLNDLVRRQKICPPPRLMLGRRLWSKEHVVQAARLLDVVVPSSILQDEEGAPHGS
jgi:hypothetical protein